MNAAALVSDVSGPEQGKKYEEHAMKPSRGVTSQLVRQGQPHALLRILVLQSLVEFGSMATGPGRKRVNLKASIHLEGHREMGSKRCGDSHSLLGDRGCVTSPLQPPAGELGVVRVSGPMSYVFLRLVNFPCSSSASPSHSSSQGP